MNSYRQLLWICFCAVGLSFGSPTAWAQPTVSQALSYRPVQLGVRFTQPDKAVYGELSLVSAKVLGQTGFLVKDAGGRLLRRFVDSTKDRKIDTWAYYRNGIEVYRDQDTDADSQPDRFQWMGTEGTRCGLDTTGDRKIDVWQRISAQEATHEAVEALKTKDAARLKALILSDAQLMELKLEKGIRDRIAKTVQETLKSLASAVSKSSLPSDARWLHFSASSPGILQTEKDWVTVYDNVSSIVAVNAKNQQLIVGSMVRVGNSWKLVEIPIVVGAKEVPAIGGLFFQVSDLPTAAVASGTSEGLESELVTRYQKTEDAIRTFDGPAASNEFSKLHLARALALKKIIATVKGKQRMNWTMQYADVVSAGYQSGDFPEGLEDLEAYIGELKSVGESNDLVGYLVFRSMGAWYSNAAGKTKNLDEVQDKWRVRLERFVKLYPKVPQAADALFQLANTEDYLGDVEAATELYRRVVNEFPDSPLRPRAKGAAIRLNSEGKVIRLIGPTISGEQFSLGRLKGSTVLIHYWATWCEPCKAEFETMHRLYTKYKKLGFKIVSVSVDEKRETVSEYLQKEKDLPWIHLHQKGGLEGSPLATQLGVVALPTMILVGSDGKVSDQSVTMQQVERELRKLRK